MKAKTQNAKETNKIVRPPIVVVMGHIDHGKTKILDWYRKTKVVEQESGGITQHIGAYEVLHHGKKITLIDTPGHQAFSKMRSRGARVADIAVLVVAADEGVKPQTKEAIETIRKNELPFVVAVNKIDKPEANIERTKQQLAEQNILVESYGGKVPSVEISAKTGDHMDDLLEVLLLLADLENLETDPEKPAHGVVIEAHLDQRRGITATLLIIDGGLARGDTLVIGRSLENVKTLENFLGKPIEQAGHSSPIRMSGMQKMPAVGDAFRAFQTREEAEAYIASLPKEEREKSETTATHEEGKPVFNLIIKADVAGSKEVIEESLKKLESEAIGINILRSEVGNISEDDINLAMATKLVTVIGFKIKMDSSVRDLAERAHVRIVQGDIIYEIFDEAKKKIEEMIPPEIRRVVLGKLKVLKVFKKDGAKQIIGGRVEEGIVKKTAMVNVLHFKELVGVGKILELQKDKHAADEVGKRDECGLLVDAKPVIEEGDLLEIIQEEIIKKTL